MVSAPAGREAEWQRLLARLQARQPALVLVTGQPGSGRTTLLVTLAAVGLELGYSVIDGQDAVTVDHATRSSDLRRIVASAPRAANQVPAKGKPEGRGLLRRIADLFAGPASDEKAITRTLKAMAPVILAVDGYTPGHQMSAWFADRLVPRILRSGSPILVVVADTPDSTAALRGAVTETIELLPVSREAVEEHLREAGNGLEPPVSDSELAAYCEAVTNDLSLLKPLEKILSVLGQER
jgi:hypothetical protein